MTELAPTGTTATSVARSANPESMDGDPAAIGVSPTELGVARAAALFERVDPAKAAALLETVLAADPQSAEGWILMARIQFVLDEV
jgi:Tfp pilus assembly protein PilF